MPTKVVSFELALNLVRSDLGIAFGPTSILADARGVCACTVTDVRWPVQLARATSRPLSAAARAVSEVVIAARP